MRNCSAYEEENSDDRYYKSHLDDKGRYWVESQSGWGTTPPDNLWRATIYLENRRKHEEGYYEIEEEVGSKKRSNAAKVRSSYWCSTLWFVFNQTSWLWRCDACAVSGRPEVAIKAVFNEALGYAFEVAHGYSSDGSYPMHLCPSCLAKMRRDQGTFQAKDRVEKIPARVNHLARIDSQEERMKKASRYGYGEDFNEAVELKREQILMHRAVKELNNLIKEQQK